MIPIRGNWLGLAMFVVGGVVAFVGGFLLKLGDLKTMIAVGIALFLMDFVVRVLNRKEKGWVFGKETGGFFFFVPVWILGLLVIIINLINASGVIKK